MGSDYVVGGCGMFGAVFARVMAESGRRVLLVDKRPHIGGNCYTETWKHQCPPLRPAHFSHQQRACVAVCESLRGVQHFRLRTPVNFGGRLFSFPINLMTLHQLWGIATPAEAEAKLAQERVPCDNPQNLEEWILAQVGREVYETFIRGYTTKQWGRDPRELPASIIRRIPIRRTYNDRYFDDRFEGIPIGGYTRMFETCWTTKTSTSKPASIIFSSVRGCISRERPSFTPARLMNFLTIDSAGSNTARCDSKNRVLDGDFQGNAIVNYTAADVPHTRIVEHKHFELTRRTAHGDYLRVSGSIRRNENSVLSDSRCRKRSVV